MKNFNFLTRLAGLALACLTSIVGWGQPAPPVVRTPMTTNLSTGSPINGDVPTYDNGTGKWTFAAPPGASGGEANTGANDGAGVGVYAGKVGITLHFNSLAGNTYLNVSSNASLLTLSVIGLQPTNAALTALANNPNLYQATNANLTLLQAFGPTTWQATNANLTALANNPNLYQATNANLTLLQAFGPTTWQATNANLTALANNPNLYQATNGNLTALANNPNLYQATNTALTRLAGIGYGTAGDIIIRDAQGWTNLAKDVDGKVLGLFGGLPSWQNAPGGAGATNIDYGSANNYTVSNILNVLGTMNLSELDTATLIVTNNATASNQIAQVALIGAFGNIVTNRVSESEVTNGITLGGVRRTTWPSGTGASYDIDVAVDSSNLTATAIWTNAIPTNTTIHAEATVLLGGPTNVGAFKVAGDFYRLSGSLTKLGTNYWTTNYTVAGMDAYFATDANNLKLYTLGATNEILHRVAKGFAVSATNGPAASGGGGGYTPAAAPSLHSWYVGAANSTDAQIYSDNGVTPCNDGDTVYRWNDQSGHGNNVVQATAGMRPVYHTNVKNSLGGITFDASDDHLECTPLSGNVSQPSTWVVVTQVDSSNPAYATSGGGTHTQIGYRSSFNSIRINAGATLNGGDDSLVNGTWYVWAFVFDGVSSKIYRNSTTPLVTGDAGSDYADAITIGGDVGGNYGWGAYVEEVVVCTQALTGSDLSDLMDYEKTKYLIP